MKDRIPTHAGRVQLTPVSGNIYDMTMADEPTEQGTALNKANLLSDATAEIVGDEFGTIPETPNEALALVGRGGKVGNIVRSVSTDLGENYALCNGDMFEPSEYPELAAVLPKNTIPKTNPNWELAYNGREEGYIYPCELYNGEFAISNNSSTFQIVDKDGKPKASCNAQDMGATSSARLWYVENNGTKYIFFVYRGSGYNDLVDIYSTTDFATFTLENTVTGINSTNYRPESEMACGNFDGLYYYYVRDVYPSGGHAISVVIIDSSFNLVGETVIANLGFRVRMCGNRAYALWYDSDSTKMGFKVLNGSAPPSTFSGYRSAAWSSSFNGLYNHVVEFNDDYDVAWGYSYDHVVFIPRDGTSALKSVALPASVGSAREVFLDGSGEKLMVAGDSGSAYCDTSALDPSQASAWHDGDIGTSHSGFYQCQYRSKTGIILYQKSILRARLLPTITETECYNYIKIK